MPDTPNTAVKTLDESGRRIGGYLVVFGSPAQKDLTGEYFHPATDLGLGIYPRLPLLYHHGADSQIGGDLIGVIDTFKTDDTGLWVEAELSKRSKYLRAIQKLIARNALSFSSGSLPHLVVKSADGRIDRWWVVEGSLTPQPAEPRHTSVAAIKSAYETLGLDFSPLEEAQDQEENGMPEELKDNLKTVAETVGTLAESVKSLHREITVARSAPVKRLPYAEPAPASRIEVARATKYSDLSASDMSFLHEILACSVRGWNPGEAFYRELADKSFHAVHNKELGVDAVKGLLQRGFTKANELDTTTQAGYGLEWAPDSWRSELWQRVRQDNVVAPLFSMIEMPTQPFELPIETTDPTVYYVPETTDASQLVPNASSPITLSKVGSGKLQMNAKKLALRVSWSSELNEDSLIPVITNYRRQSLRAMQNAIDNLLLNGDTATAASTNINLIDGTPLGGTKYLPPTHHGSTAPVMPPKAGGGSATQPRNCPWTGKPWKRATPLARIAKF